MTIRGEVIRTEEGSWLSATESGKQLVVGGRTWWPEAAIHLTPPYSPLVEFPQSPVPEVIEDSASEELLKKCARDPDVRIWETIRGRLETRLNFEMVLVGDGMLRP